MTEPPRPQTAAPPAPRYDTSPTAIVLEYQRALDAIRRGATDEAEKMLATLVRKAPGTGRAHDALGRLLHRKGRHDGAIRHFGAAMQLIPNDPAIPLRLAEACESAGRAADAAAALERFLKRHPGAEEVARRLSALRDRPGPDG